MDGNTTDTDHNKQDTRQGLCECVNFYVSSYPVIQNNNPLFVCDKMFLKKSRILSRLFLNRATVITENSNHSITDSANSNVSYKLFFFFWPPKFLPSLGMCMAWWTPYFRVENFSDLNILAKLNNKITTIETLQKEPINQNQSHVPSSPFTCLFGLDCPRRK